MGLGRFWRRLSYLARQSHVERELREEMEYHRARKEEELRERGLTRDEARWAASRRMGNLALAAEDARGVWMVRWLESLSQDLRFAFRGLRRQPVFTLTAVLALALGIGVNTAMFTVLNALLLRPWDVRQPERVVSVFAVKQIPGEGMRYKGMPYPLFASLRDRIRLMQSLVASRREGSHLLTQGQGATGRASIGYVSGNYFQMLGVQPAWGRFFVPEEDRVSGPKAVAVLSHEFWASHFNSDRAVIGRTLFINYKPFLVIGVAPEDFQGTELVSPEIWLPMAALPLLQPDSQMLSSANWCCVQVFGRLAAGTARAQAQQELTSLYKSAAEAVGREADPVYLGEARFLTAPDTQRRILPALLLIWLGVMLVTLVACANVANLLLARGAARRHELATRLSLGAGRLRLVRQLLVETALLALFGGAGGVALAAVLPGMVVRGMAPERLALTLTPDWRVALYTVLLCGLASLACGLAPAFQSTADGLAFTLRREQAMAGRGSLRSLLLGAQIALCMILLTGAGLMVRGLQAANRTDPGMETKNVAIVTLDLRLLHYDQPKSRAFVEQLVERAARLPHVAAVAQTVLPPLGNVRMVTSVDGVANLEELRKQGLDRVSFNEVSASYFDTLRIPLRRGGAQPAGQPGESVVVNESMAKRFWPDRDPVGQLFKAGRQQRVVGVCGDASENVAAPPQPTFYRLAEPIPDTRLVVRTDQDPQAAVGAILQIAHQLDPRLRPTVATLEENIAGQLETARACAALVAALGAFALLLAGIGVYGVAAFMAQRRFKEIGIRMALGAGRGSVIITLLRGNLRVAAIGVFVGLIGAGLLSRLLREFLFGLSPLDPVAYAVVALLLTGSALLATYLPARKATAIDPTAALRYE
jgi:predicted permease